MTERYRPRCEDCVYYEPKGERGQCRRIPPVVLADPRGGGRVFTKFPAVGADDWCGAWTRIGRVKTYRDDPYGFLDDVALMGRGKADGIDGEDSEEGEA